MNSYYLRFDTEQQAITVLSQYRSEKGAWITASHTHALDPVGVIYEPTGETELIGGLETPIMAPIAGWHVNMKLAALPDELQSYAITPATPSRMFAESPVVVPTSVSALQGMLAISRSGLVPAFMAWKATLDPVADFEVIAFLDKAETWEYDNPILDGALTALKVIDQKPALFILAGTL